MSSHYVHAVQELAKEGSRRGPVTTNVGTALGVLAAGAFIASTGGLVVPAALGILASGSYVGLLGGGSLGHITKK